MDSNLLKHFLTVYERGSLGQASTDLHLSQPALSKSIRRLEDRLGVQLFERTASGMVPTQFAIALARRAKIVEAELAYAEEEISQLRDAKHRHLTFGATQAVADVLLSGLTTRIRSLQPELKLTVIEGFPEELAAAVLDGTLEFAVCSSVVPTEGELAGLPLFQDQFVIVAGAKHELTRKSVIRPHDLLDTPWVMRLGPGLVRQWLVDFFCDTGLSCPEPVVETTSTGYMKGLAIGAGFLTFLPRQQVEKEVHAGELWIVPVWDQRWVRQISAIYRSRGLLSTASRMVIEELRKSAS